MRAWAGSRPILGQRVKAGALLGSLYHPNNHGAGQETAPPK